MAARAEERAIVAAVTARNAKKAGRASMSRVAADADISELLGGPAKGSGKEEAGLDTSPLGKCDHM
jgi:hypothetical protein